MTSNARHRGGGELPAPDEVPPLREFDPEDLESLARAAQAGNTVAFDTLVGRVFDRVYRWALVRVGDADDAEDVTQRVLIRLHSALAGWEGRSRLSTWLFRITANEASSWSRRAARRTRGLVGARRDSAPVEAPDRGHDARRLADLALLLFRDLPARQRQILDLIDLQGFTPTETAEMLDMNPNTVRANLFKARRTLRARILAERPDAPELLP